MTKTTTTPFALALAALTFVALWAPTITVPAAAQVAPVSVPALA